MESRGLRSSKATGKFAPIGLKSDNKTQFKVLKSPSKKKNGEQHQRYKKISNETRAEIVQRIIDDKASKALVARKLRLSYTTVCSIIETYKKEGRINKIHQRQRKKKKLTVLASEKLDEEEKDLKEDKLVKQEATALQREPLHENLKIEEEHDKMKLEKGGSNRSTLNPNDCVSKLEWFNEEPLKPEKLEISHQVELAQMRDGQEPRIQPVFPHLQWNFSGIFNISPPLASNLRDYSHYQTLATYLNNHWTLPLPSQLQMHQVSINRSELPLQNSLRTSNVSNYFGVQNQNLYK